jgi:large subunit ribosomal protein L54
MVCTRCLPYAARSSKQLRRWQRSWIRLSIQTSRTTRMTPHSNFTTSCIRAATSISVNHATGSAPRQGSPDASHNPPAATSTSAAQPFSTPLTPSPENAGIDSHPQAATDKKLRMIQSSVPAGTPLHGLNFTKGQSDPVAKADDEYPSWLWNILGDLHAGEGMDDDGDGPGDLFGRACCLLI